MPLGLHQRPADTVEFQLGRKLFQPGHQSSTEFVARRLARDQIEPHQGALPAPTGTGPRCRRRAITAARSSTMTPPASMTMPDEPRRLDPCHGFRPDYRQIDAAVLPRLRRLVEDPARSGRGRSVASDSQHPVGAEPGLRPPATCPVVHDAALADVKRAHGQPAIAAARAGIGFVRGLRARRGARHRRPADRSGANSSARSKGKARFLEDRENLAQRAVVALAEAPPSCAAPAARVAASTCEGSSPGRCDRARETDLASRPAPADRSSSVPRRSMRNTIGRASAICGEAFSSTSTAMSGGRAGCRHSTPGNAALPCDERQHRSALAASGTDRSLAARMKSTISRT